MDKPEKINDSLSLFSLRGSLDFGTDAYLLSAYIIFLPFAEFLAAFQVLWL